MIFDKLKQLGQSAYTLLGKGKDAIFDLMDAVLTSLRVNSLVVLQKLELDRGTLFPRVELCGYLKDLMHEIDSFPNGPSLLFQFALCASCSSFRILLSFVEPC